MKPGEMTPFTTLAALPELEATSSPGVAKHAYRENPRTGWCYLCERPDRNPVHDVEEPPKLYIGIDLGLSETTSLSFMIRFVCGCWRRIGSHSDEVFNAYHCTEHIKNEKGMDGL